MVFLFNISKYKSLLYVKSKLFYHLRSFFIYVIIFFLVGIVANLGYLLTKSESFLLENQIRENLLMTECLKK